MHLQWSIESHIHSTPRNPNSVYLHLQWSIESMHSYGGAIGLMDNFGISNGVLKAERVYSVPLSALAKVCASPMEY